MIRGWAVLVAAACACAGSGCGGGSGQLTKAEYVREANRVCRTAAVKVRAVAAPDPGDAVAVARAGAKVVAIQRHALDELKALRPPSDDRPRIVKWVALVDQTLDQASASVDAQRHGDASAAVTANQHGAVLDERADEIARAYGLRSCGAATAPAT